MKISNLKKEALASLKGKYKIFILICLFAYALYSLSTLLEAFIPNKLIAFILVLAFTIFYCLITYGIAVISLKVLRKEDFSFKTLFTESFKNPKGVYRVAFKTILYLLVPVICVIASYIALAFGLGTLYINGNYTVLLIGLVATFISLIILVVCSLNYSLTNYLLYDNPTATGKEINQASQKLMKKHKGKLILLFLSFIGWIFLVVLGSTIVSLLITTIFKITNEVMINLYTNFISFIGMAFLAPYLYTTCANFYETLSKENSSEKTEN